MYTVIESLSEKLFIYLFVKGFTIFFNIHTNKMVTICDMEHEKTIHVLYVIKYIRKRNNSYLTETSKPRVDKCIYLHVVGTSFFQFKIIR